MPPAARLTDPHSCSAVTGVVPHVGGPIEGPGAPKVLVGGLPAACVGDKAACNGPPDVLIQGSATVMIGGVPAVRMGDPTEHGGMVDAGAADVMIGG